MAIKKKKTVQKKVYKIRNPEMSVAIEKVRLVISCTEQEKMYIKMLAAKENKTVTDYLLSTPRENMPRSKCRLKGCKGDHKPNKLTAKVLRESERGENLEHHDTIEDFWKSMGIDPNVED
jgi:hypothetical protein